MIINHKINVIKSIQCIDYDIDGDKRPSFINNNLKSNPFAHTLLPLLHLFPSFIPFYFIFCKKLQKFIKDREPFLEIS